MGEVTTTDAPEVQSEEMIDPRCIVKFRPGDDWEGEYGFDWFREGDYEERTENNNFNVPLSELNNNNGRYVIDNKTKSISAGRTSYKELVGLYGVLYSNNSYFYYDDAGPMDNTDYDNNRFFTPHWGCCEDFIRDNNYKTITINYNSNNIQTGYDDNGNYLKGVQFNDNQYKYIVPTLNLFFPRKNLKNGWGKTSAKINIIVEQNNVPYNNVYFVCEDCKNNEIDIDVSLFESKSEITITIKKLFYKVKTIKAYSRTNEEIKKDEKGKLAGELQVECCKPKYLDVVFVPIAVRKNKGISIGPFKILQDFSFSKKINKNETVDEKHQLQNLFLQAGVVANVFIDREFQKNNKEEIDRVIEPYWRFTRTGWGICTYDSLRDKQIQKELEELYNNNTDDDNMYKIFLLNDNGCLLKDGIYVNCLYGQACDIPSTSAIIFELDNAPRYPSVVFHELLHCLGLIHSFSQVGKQYAFLQYATSNIMDYYNAWFQLYTLWKSQWNQIRAACRIDKTASFLVAPRQNNR